MVLNKDWRNLGILGQVIKQKPMDKYIEDGYNVETYELLVMKPHVIYTINT